MAKTEKKRQHALPDWLPIPIAAWADRNKLSLNAAKTAAKNGRLLLNGEIAAWFDGSRWVVHPDATYTREWGGAREGAGRKKKKKR